MLWIGRVPGSEATLITIAYLEVCNFNLQARYSLELAVTGK
jgi:hypothetical protein